MSRGWVALWRKSKASDVFAHEGLWKLWSLCLMNANHKAKSVQVEGVLKPVMVQRGQFITGRYLLHGEYHQWRKGYKKKKPSDRTLWRWLHTLKDMGMITIRSYNKYSLVTVIKYDEYQSRYGCSTEVFHENQGNNADFDTDSEKKSQKLTTRKPQINQDILRACGVDESKNDQQMTNRRPSGDHKQQCINNDKENITQQAEALFSRYPRIIDRAKSIKSIINELKSETPLEDMEAALENYLAIIRRDGTEPKFVIGSKEFFAGRWKEYKDGSVPQSFQTGEPSRYNYLKCCNCPTQASNVEIKEDGLPYCVFCWA